MKTKLTKDENDTIARWRWEIRNAREAIAMNMEKIRQLKARPIRSKDPISELSLRCVVGDYRTIVRSRQSAIKNLKEGIAR